MSSLALAVSLYVSLMELPLTLLWLAACSIALLLLALHPLVSRSSLWIPMNSPDLAAQPFLSRGCRKGQFPSSVVTFLSPCCSEPLNKRLFAYF